MKSIAATGAREHFAELVHEVSEQKQKFIIERRGKPCAVVVPLEDLEPIQGRVDQILHEGQQRLKDFADASSDWFWEMDADCRFSYFSTRFTEITGVPQEALLGKTREETGVPDGSPEEWEGHLADLAAHRSFRNFQHPRSRPDGQVVHLSINGKAIFDEAGNFLGYRGSGSDVTQFTRTQNELRESEKQLDLIAKTSNVPMFITRVSDGTYLYFNTTGAEIFGLSVEELVGRSSRDFYQNPSDRKKLLAEIQNKGSVQNLELRFKNVDGGTIWVLDSVIPLKYRGEDALLSTVIDITEHKQTEEALRENQEALARAQRQGQIGSWRWSIERDELISCSEEYANIHGVGLEEVWKLLEHQMERVVHPDDRDRVSAEFKRVDEEGVDYKIEYRIVRPDGDIRHVLEIGEVVMDETGNAIEQTGTVQDITERKQAEEALQKAHDELEMRVEQRTEELQRSNEQLQQEEAKLRGILENSPIGVAICSSEGGDTQMTGDRLFVNSALVQMFSGSSQKSFIEAQVQDSWVDLEQLKTVQDVFKSGGELVDFEVQRRRMDGTKWWVSMSSRPIEFDGQDCTMIWHSDISERKKVEEARQEVERRFQAIVNYSPSAISLVDTEGRYLLVNRKWQEWFNPEGRDVAGKTVCDFYPADVADRSSALDREILETGVEASGEHVTPRADGTLMAALWQKFLVADGNGKIIALGTINTDITERKRMEETLRESEARLDEALEAMSEGFIYFDAQNRLVRANSKHRELFPSHAELMVPGARFEDLLRKQVQNIRLPWAEGREEAWIANRLAQHRTPGKPVEQEFADGRIIRLSEYRTKSGGMVSIRTDITEQKEIEKRLRESEARLKRAQEIARIGSFVWDGKNNEVVYRSDVIYEIYGLPPEAAPQNFEETQEIMHPDDRERIRETFAAATDAKTPYDVEYRIIHSDGKVRHVREMNEFQFDDKGALIGSAGTFQDITSLKQAEDALRQAQKMEAVGQLTGGLSHDFNNLLAIIMGNAQLLEAKLEDDDVRELLEPMIGATKRGAELTFRLLAFSRQQALNPQAIDIGELCMGMMTLLRRTLGETIEIDLRREDLSPARADPGQLENALLNLALNARDAMPEGGKLTIEAENVTLTGAGMEAHPEGHAGDYVMLKVADIGTGMAPDVIEHVFEPFFTTKDVGAGSGLGLSMVYGFAQQSGGHVTIESEEGHGTTVALYLPEAEAPAEEAQRKAVDEELPRGQGESVLVVEDEPDLRLLTVRQLEKLGYKTLEAPDGPAALTVLADSGEIDLLLSDVVLPGGMNGPQIYQQGREQRPDLRCLLMSGYAVTPEGTLPEGVDLLGKPFRLVELAKRLRSVLRA